MLASKSLPELDSAHNPDQTPTLNVFLFHGTDVDLEDPTTLRLRKPLVLSADLRHPQIHLEHRHDHSSPSGMQFARFPRLVSSHFPLVGKGTTDETITTSENVSINVDETFVSLYIITLSMFLSINVSMYLSLANERERNNGDIADSFL